MSQNTFSMAGGVARNPLVRLAKPITSTIGANEHIAIVGPNGGGKSLFVDTLIGKYPLREGTIEYDFSPSATQTVYDNVKYIAFRDTYGAADANYYYQQRWNAHDQDETPDVREMLGEIKDEQLKNELFELFRIEPLLDKKIILLSSGELRKFQLTKTLLKAPRVLIMDNPFIGLDAPTRELLFSLLERLTKMSSVQIILVLSMMDDIPSFITHVIPVDKMEVFSKMEREAYLTAFRNRDAATSFDELQKRIIDLPYDGNNYDSDEVVKLNKVSIRYGDRTILNELDWTVHRGEKWALSGENGAGKSTLLQLMTGLLSNYTGSITIENMPVVKKNYNKIRTLLGFVFQDFDSQLFMPTIKQDIAFGLENLGFDNIDQRVNNIAKMLNITDILNKPAFKLSGGEKKLASLGTILAIEPKCILLDEPTTGLDPRNRKVLINIIKNLDKTKIITTHDLDMAMEICQRVIVLSNGKIVADGNPHDILLNEDIMLNNGLELPLGKY